MAQVSVVLPTYNRADIIDRAIESVLSQSYEDFELLIIDDCSTDRTVDVVKKYTDPRITLIRHDENKGGGAARNTGIQNAAGDYIAFIDSDDSWAPDKLEKQINRFENLAQDIGVVYTGIYVVEGDRKTPEKYSMISGDIFEKQLIKDHIPPTSAIMARTACFSEVGLFDVHLPARQDYDMWLRIAEEFNFEYVKERLVTIYRDRTDRISGDIEKLVKAEKRLLEKKRLRYDIEKLDTVTAQHYLSIARRAYVYGQFTTAKRYSRKSLQNRPTLVAGAIYFLSNLEIDRNNVVVDKIIDTIR
ncbi:glycosyltransferase family 2 protein [Natrinema caseinilyticum]|uniref:glycosyltransferase family 2 protein n=1 Tax=Natrinema caseinilyticum TaxID=2961570 RepID=UPI0020C2E104|nr:glycosyltransferase family 2 protein [Natrinema caseinilyticum]